jgi:uncharacterized membrane protein (DUF106 family)
MKTPMKKHAIIISIIAIFVTLIADIGDLRCQGNSNITAEHDQLQNMGKSTKEFNEDNVMDDKNRMVEMLGRIIQHNLYNACQKIDSRELEERLL